MKDLLEQFKEALKKNEGCDFIRWYGNALSNERLKMIIIDLLFALFENGIKEKDIIKYMDSLE